MSKGIGTKFMQQTKYGQMGPSQQDRKYPQPPLEKTYPDRAKLFELPKPTDLSIADISLRKAIENRKSLRKYSSKHLTLKELSFLLWTTQGVKTVATRPVTIRNVPSAGARHAFETYILVNKVKDLQPGLYRYIATKHSILLEKKGIILAARLTAACLAQAQVLNSAVTFFWVAIVERMYWRYDERGYRYLHLDAGHVCQNLYLAAEAIDSGVCAIAAFNDDMVNKVLGLDGEKEFAIYIASLGKKQSVSG
jgi:SagB-type dehydrogenase family enzyme